MAGANPAAVQRILRHSDPRITTEVYGHLVPDYLRAEIDRLSFGIAPPTKPSNDSPTLGALPTGLATSVLHPPPIERFATRKSCRTPPRISRSSKGGRGGTRTHYPRLRRPVLYPDELRARKVMRGGRLAKSAASGQPSFSFGKPRGAGR